MAEECTPPPGATYYGGTGGALYRHTHRKAVLPDLMASRLLYLSRALY